VPREAYLANEDRNSALRFTLHRSASSRSLA